MNALWAALLEDSGADLAVVSGEGEVLWAGGWAAWWAEGLAGATVVGKKLGDLMPADVAAERLELVQRALRTGRVVVLHEIWRGVRIRTVMRPTTDPHGRPVVLLTGRGQQAVDVKRPERPEYERVDAKAVDHGKLGILTPRELQILSMIAQGLTTAQIAEALYRSRKTIEAHRLALGAKLGVRNRVELARIAVEAGLLAAAPSEVQHRTGRRYQRRVSEGGPHTSK